MMIGNVTCAVEVEFFGNDMVFFRDPQCPWVCTLKQFDVAIGSLADATFVDDHESSARSIAFQALCDLIQPVCTDGAARDMLARSRLTVQERG